MLLIVAASALAEVHYVDLNSTNATPPYTNWATAATNIQDAVDAAVAGDEIVVADGIYATGGRNFNRVEVDKPLNVRSVNGSQFTTIDGGQSNLCVTLTGDATLSSFTLTNGYGGYGGGAYGGTLSNCMLTGNSAGYGDGGGAYVCTLNSCTLTGNSTLDGNGGGAAYCTLTGNSANHATANYCATGGGAYSCTLNNCTLTGNSANELSGSGDPTFGGGAYKCALNYCIFYSNFATYEADYGSSSTASHCRTTDPLLVDTNGRANLRLQPNSPCINAGNNSYATKATDLDGNPRFSGGTVDIGAYEYQWPQLAIAPSDPNVLLSWPTNNAGYDYTGFTLQSTTNLGSPVAWVTNSPTPVVIGWQNTVTNPITCTQKVFRLVQ